MSDDTLHFPHPRTHPDVVYVPRHVLEHSTPTTGVIALGIGIALAVVTVALLFRGGGSRTKGVGVLLGVLSVPLILTGSHISANRGTYLGVLPERTHDMGLGQPDSGDNEREYYFSRNDALAKAQETGRGQDLPASSARAVAIPWDKIPVEDRQEMKLGEPDLLSLPNDSGWSEADSLIVRDYLKKSYGITLANTDWNEVQHYTEAVSAPGMSSDTYPAKISNSTLVNVPGNPLHVEGEYEHYRCLLHLDNYRKNDTGQPVSATPGKVECFSNYDVDDVQTPVTKNTRRVYPKKLN